MEHRILIKTVQGTVLSLNEFKNQKLQLQDAVGIVLQTPVVGMIISLDAWEEIWGECGRLITSEKGDSQNLMDLSGLELTKQIIEIQKESGFNKMTAAKRCWEYNKGGLQWYLPCVYELCTMFAFWPEIRDTMIGIGMDADDVPEEGWHWSSSENGSYYAVIVTLSSGTIHTYGKSNTYSVRAVSAFSPLDSFNPLPCERCEQGTFDLSSISDKELVDEMKKRGFAGKVVKTFEL